MVLGAGYWLGTKDKLSDLPSIGSLIGNHASSTTATSTATSTEAAADAETEAASAPAPTPASTQTYTPPPATTPSAPVADIPSTYTVTAYITQISNSIIGIDLVDVHTGDQAVNFMIQDSLCSIAKPERCNLENNKHYRNTDIAVQYFILMPNVEIQKWTGTKNYVSNLKQAPSDTIYTITINEHNQVVRIKEVYRV